LPAHAVDVANTFTSAVGTAMVCTLGLFVVSWSAWTANLTAILPDGLITCDIGTEVAPATALSPL
jgi:hypothetical protein